jgi:hypothetical protein
VSLPIAFLPLVAPHTAQSGPQAVPALNTEQHRESRAELDDVMWLWLSSIRRNYRRRIRGRSTLVTHPMPLPRVRPRVL